MRMSADHDINWSKLSLCKRESVASSGWFEYQHSMIPNTVNIPKSYRNDPETDDFIVEQSIKDYYLCEYLNRRWKLC